MINYQQASNEIDSQFIIEQSSKPENSLRTTGIEPVPSDCEQQAQATRKMASLWEVYMHKYMFICYSESAEPVLPRNP